MVAREIDDVMEHLSRKKVSYIPVSSPPVLSPVEDNNTSDWHKSSVPFSFREEKRSITREHRQECVVIFEYIFGDVPVMEADLVIINFFPLEGWSLAELFNVRCVIAAPYIVPYSAPSSFERKFSEELPLLYDFLQEASSDKICWKDVMHWMWPFLTDDWGTWRATKLQLGPLPFTDPVTSNLVWHSRPSSPLLLYGFSKEVVECPVQCAEVTVLTSSENWNMKVELCSAHTELQQFLNAPASLPPVFIGLSSIGSMGFMRKTQLLLRVLQSVIELSSYRFILFSSGYGPLDAATRILARETSLCSEKGEPVKNGISLFSDRLFYFSGQPSAEDLQNENNHGSDSDEFSKFTEQNYSQDPAEPCTDKEQPSSAQTLTSENDCPDVNTPTFGSLDPLLYQQSYFSDLVPSQLLSDSSHDYANKAAQNF
ncbi:UDP-glucuronosyl/UDP-glucosyltransferase [Artemisia annua]|uniref:UDP-glucuronosyl/UDP-glucosyltransferase n=1 Tax=Artemisia annua TaxID=35608 RepID=A0A2U1NPM8_ARTAN|nr:UDP-glucuronosyl/UDP-glucosyltransferase [Artemisia annua]